VKIYDQLTKVNDTLGNVLNAFYTELQKCKRGKFDPSKEKDLKDTISKLVDIRAQVFALSNNSDAFTIQCDASATNDPLNLSDTEYNSNDDDSYDEERARFDEEVDKILLERGKIEATNLVLDSIPDSTYDTFAQELMSYVKDISDRIRYTPYSPQLKRHVEDDINRFIDQFKDKFRLNEIMLFVSCELDAHNILATSFHGNASLKKKLEDAIARISRNG